MLSPKFSIAAILTSLLPVLSFGQEAVRWRYSYEQARREAKQMNRPLLIDFGTKNCFWCDKLDQTTFRDPQIVQLLNAHFVPLKVKASQYPKLVQALAIEVFPTLVLADANGRILGKQAGYIDAPVLQKHLQGTLAKLRSDDRQESPIRQASLERAAPPSASDQRTLARRKRAQELFDQAQADFERRDYPCCLVRCQTLLAYYADMPQAGSAKLLSERIKNDPRLVNHITERMLDCLGELYLQAAEDSLKKSDRRRAVMYLERVVQTCPGTRHEISAKNRLVEIRAATEGRNNPLKSRSQSH
ncbi:MAG: hypothetical protein KatS3mg105_1514 [Gemmatales bacterium]|nr:MAG: hypothetical protein KatS3mg105_1514 [Gemmatales bacterium]